MMGQGQMRFPLVHSVITLSHPFESQAPPAAVDPRFASADREGFAEAGGAAPVTRLGHSSRPS